MKQLRYRVEAVFVWLFFGLFWLIGWRAASALGSFLARHIGPRLKAHQIARRNLEMIFPRKKPETIDRILHGMWDNLGRTVGEFVHVPNLLGEAFDQRVTVRGLEHIERLQRRRKKTSFMFFSGHFANWELGPQMTVAKGFPMLSVYRPANNPYVDRMIQKSRTRTLKGMVPKGLKAAREIVATIQAGEPVGMLVDQKFNEGMMIPFMGRPAMTATALAEFAKKYDVPLVPAQVVRKKNGKFVIHLSPPLTITGKSTAEIMLEVNVLLESWIREHPEQWFWVHKRWPAA